MSKPPTSQRGRQARTPTLAAPPAQRPWLRRFGAAEGPYAGRSAGRVVPRPQAPAERPGRHRTGSTADGPGLDRLETAAGPPEGGQWPAASDDSERDSPRALLAAVSTVGTWRAILTTALCLAGLGVSIYLTIAHYEHYTLACPANSTFNCEAVTHSAESFVFGIPVALLGLVFFVPMLALCSPWAWRSASRYVAPLRMAGVVTGVGFVFYLIYSELFVIGNICLWCSSVHLITLVLFVVVATGWDEARGPARFAVEPDQDWVDPN